MDKQEEGTAWRKAGLEIFGGLAVLKGPLQGVLRRPAYEWGRRREAKSKRQTVTSTSFTKQWERVKPFREKGSSEGTKGLLVGKEKKRSHRIINRRHYQLRSHMLHGRKRD